MTRITRVGRSLAVLGAASLVLAACGGDDGDEGAGGDNGEGSQDPLHIGTLLPETGNLAFLGPPEFAGVDLAAQEINEAGGVFGQDVEITHRDSSDADNAAVTQQSTDDLLAEGVSAIVGAASSGVSFTVIDKIVDSGTVMISPANTSPDFSTYEDDGLYFRTAPSDVIQGAVLGDTIIADGHLDVAIMNLDDAYGNGLREFSKEAIEAGGGTVVVESVYDPKAASFSAEVSEVAAAQPEALALIGFEESTTILTELANQGVGPQELPVYFVDGNVSNYGDEFPEGFLEGNKGTQPGAEIGDEFQQRLLEVDPELTDFNYSAESYDATMLVALAAIAADSTEPADIAAEMVNVSRDGTECTAFEECASLLEEGEDIDYNGASGPIEFNDVGDPTTATIGVFQYGADNLLTPVDYVQRSIE